MRNAQTGASSLEVYLHGLMVGCYNPRDKQYEVGILPSPNHVFRIMVEEMSTEGECNSWSYLTRFTGRIWSLCAGNAQQAKPPAEDDGNFDRGGDPSDDWRWVIDLDNKREFPDPQTLPFEKDLLRPILYIKHGMLHTDWTSITVALQRRRLGCAWSDFGKIAQTMVIDQIELEPGEQAVLLTDAGEELFRLKSDTDSNNTFKVFICNTPLHQSLRPAEGHDPVPALDPNRPTHFQLYYSLFNIAATSRYDFRIAPGGRHPQAPDPYECGMVYLSQTSRLTPPKRTLKPKESHRRLKVRRKR